MASSFSRRSPRAWWIIGILGTLLVLVGNAAFRTAQQKENDPELAGRQYVDSVRPLLTSSNTAANNLNSLLSTSTPKDQTSLLSDLSRLADAAQADSTAALAVYVPNTLGEAGSLLTTTLTLRARGMRTVSEQFPTIFSGAETSTVSAALADAGADFIASDRTFDVFLTKMQAAEQAQSLPQTHFVSNGLDWDKRVLETTVDAIRNQTAGSSAVDVGVVLFDLDPPVLRKENNVSILPPTGNLKTQIVISNLGTTAVRNMQVSATVTPSDATTPDTARDFISLEPGQRFTVRLGGLKAPADVVCDFTVRVEPATGEVNVVNNSQSIKILMSTPA